MATVLLKPEEPVPARPRGGWALWALGFRPFYLLAALWAVLSIPLWAAQMSGHLGSWTRGMPWHAHEMVFGYTLAIVVGFLFTAGRNWSGQPTPTGRHLQALAALWLLARGLGFTPWLLAAGLANAAFAWASAWALWRALRAGHNRRNDFFPLLLVGLGLASLGLHLQALGWLAWPEGLGLPIALDVVLFMIAVMAGRVVPMFSNNGVPGMQARRDERLEKAALGGVLALMAADALGLHGLPLAVLLLALAAAHTARWALWQPWRTLRHPLVWVLHAAYLWLPLHLLLRAGATLDAWPLGPATHALTLGTIGGMTIGMITRTALGHTGRPLQAGPFETTAFVAMLGAALVRVAVPLLWPAGLLMAVHLSATLWVLAFVAYLARYVGILSRPRLDGKPG